MTDKKDFKDYYRRDKDGKFETWYEANKTLPKPYKVKPNADVLTVAAELVASDRAAMYGPPIKQYKKLAALWSDLLGVEITEEKAVLMLIAMKLQRAFDQVPDAEGSTDEKNKHWDSIVDIAGYSAVLGLIEKSKGWWQ